MYAFIHKLYAGSIVLICYNGYKYAEVDFKSIRWIVIIDISLFSSHTPSRLFCAQQFGCQWSRIMLLKLYCSCLDTQSCQTLCNYWSGFPFPPAEGHYSYTSALIPSGRGRWFGLPTYACSDLNVRAACYGCHTHRFQVCSGGNSPQLSDHFHALEKEMTLCVTSCHHLVSKPKKLVQHL